MTDRRELILLRLFAILQTIPSIRPDVKTVARNRGELPDNLRPGLVLLDADETVRVAAPQQHRGNVQAASSTVDMTPEVWIALEQREAQNAKVGEDLDALRMIILQNVFSDPQLPGILGSNGDMRYAGATTDLAQGRSMSGEMHVRMTFTYPLLRREYL